MAELSQVRIRRREAEPTVAVLEQEGRVRDPQRRRQMKEEGVHLDSQA
jgi:hypothetical protein